MTKYVTATPVYGWVNVRGDIGVLVRKTPAYGDNVIRSVRNDNVLELTGETVVADGLTWISVRTDDGYDGWVAEENVRTATPAPN